MKVGDLVKDNHPSRHGAERCGIILGFSKYRTRFLTNGYNNNEYRVLWRDGTIGNNVWDYDLKIIKSS